MSENKNLYAVILAGGSGTRFWPMSRQDHPKQFLSMTGRQTLLQQTIARIRQSVAPSRILIVTGKTFRAKILKEARAFQIPAANVLLEPQGKNTAPAIAWAAACIYKKNPAAVMAIFPSDHLILNTRAFKRYLQAAARLAEQDYLVTMGIVPTRPETGYGYLQIKPFVSGGKKIWKVARFTEKPPLAVAQKYLRGKKHLWNSGMFVWRCAVILRAFREFLPEVFVVLKNAGPRVSPQAWKQLPGISIDYGILEQADNVVTVPAKDMGWSDVGIWESLTEVLTKDKAGNIHRGNVIELDCRDTLVFGDRRLVAAVGLKDVIVIDTADALLVCRKDCSGKVKELVEILKKQQRNQYL